MPNNFKYLALGLLMPVLTIVVWFIWVFVMSPAMRNQILGFASQVVEKKIIPAMKKKPYRYFSRRTH